LKKHNQPLDICSNSNDVNITVNPEKYTNNESFNPDHVNSKWFLNLSKIDLPHQVSTLLQFGGRFCLPTHINKKLAIHEYIKDIESNSTFQNSNKQSLIRNIAIPQFYKFLKNTQPRNQWDDNIMYKLKITNQFCKNNKNIIFTRADKGNITVALDKDSYLQKIEELLKDDNTYTSVTKNPIHPIEKNLNCLLKN